MNKHKVLVHRMFDFYGDLTVGDLVHFPPQPKVVETETITLPSAINNMKGTGELKKPAVMDLVKIKKPTTDSRKADY